MVVSRFLRKPEISMADAIIRISEALALAEIVVAPSTRDIMKKTLLRTSWLGPPPEEQGTTRAGADVLGDQCKAWVLVRCLLFLLQKLSVCSGPSSA